MVVTEQYGLLSKQAKKCIPTVKNKSAYLAAKMKVGHKG